MSKKLTGKVALVTGGSRGIGAAIAKRLADDGADVIISYSASADRADAVVREISSKGVRSASIKADQAKASEVEKLVKSVVEKFGKLDILVNNAAVFVTAGADGKADYAALDRQQAINIGGVIAAVRATSQVISNNGRIITIGSVAGDRAFPGIAEYAATKAAVAGYMRGVSLDLAPKQITVNTVQPGPIDTEMNPDNGSDFANGVKSQIPLGRYGKPEEIAAAVAFLAGPDAAYITGTTLTVAGGF